MEKGNLRADVNVSVRKPGAPLGTRCEIKNVNSIRFIGQAIEHEARRQIEIIEDGGKIEQETRLFDPDKGETRSMRTKEEAHDYRYFPDPDLLPLEFDRRCVDGLEGALAGTARRKEGALHARATGFPPMTPACSWRSGRLRNFSKRWSHSGPRRAKLAANWVINELAGRLNKEGKDIAAVAGVSSAARRDSRSDRGRHDLRQDRQGPFEIVWTEGGDPRAIVEARGMKQVTDAGGDRKTRRRDHRQESRTRWRRQDQSEGDRLVCRPGDESVRRQSQPASGQRSSQAASRYLSATFVGARACGKFRRARCACAPSIAKISRSRLPRARRRPPTAPRKRIACTDSCVLRPETPPESLFGRFAAKIFCLGKSAAASALAAAISVRTRSFLQRARERKTNDDA